MSELSIQLNDAATSYRAGATLSGVASWQLDSAVDALEVRLLWFTRGKGTQDVSVIAKHEFRAPALAGRKEFSFTLPAEPYSFSGRLISLIWALELVTPKGKQSTRVEFVLSPYESEIVLGSPDDAPNPRDA